LAWTPPGLGSSWRTGAAGTCFALDPRGRD
jgi:hypothetical protein